VNGPGFTFWGLFLACALIVLGYALWMLWAEAIERGESAERTERTEWAEPAQNSGHGQRRAVDTPPPSPGQDRGDGS
jgi:hypothetical protein